MNMFKKIFFPFQEKFNELGLKNFWWHRAAIVVFFVSTLSYCTSEHVEYMRKHSDLVSLLCSDKAEVVACYSRLMTLEVHLSSLFSAFIFALFLSYFLQISYRVFLYIKYGK